MALVSGKALWSIICGQSVLASDEVVGEELENASLHLQEGLLYYKTWSEEDHKSWSCKSKLKKEQQDFVYKIGKMLEVCSEQAWEIFQLFLQYEYRGSASQLQVAASNDREETSLLHQVYSFYLSDPLHLLSCRRHILAADSSHPYEKLFKEFLNKVFDPDHTLGIKLVAQLKKMNVKELPVSKIISPHLTSTQSISPHLPLNAIQARISYNLSAIKHQLATLLVYHGSPGNPCPPESVCTLLQLAQGAGLGRTLLGTVGRSDKNTFHTQFEAIDALHSFLLTLAINADSDPKNHPLCTPEWVSTLNPLIHSLGSKPWHFPPILAWAVLQGRRIANDAAESTEEASKYSRLVQRAIKGNVFQYLQSTLKNTAFESDQLLLIIGASITYSLICIVGTCLDLDKIGLMAQAHQLAKVCLAFEPTSHFFWNEEGGGANVLLPSALEVFPHSFSSLLELMTSLASANKFSASKVVELMKELESFTWPLLMHDPYSISASGSQCVTKTAIMALPGFIIPKDTHGILLNPNTVATAENPILVCWELPTNGWRVLLHIFQQLLNQIDSGGVADEWSLGSVIGGLRLLSAVLRTDPQHSFLFQDIQNVAQLLLVSISQILKPNYNLISALMEYFAEVSKLNCSTLWNELDGCALLPSLPKSKTAKKNVGRDLLVNYRAGNIRALICGVEANTGSFSVLQHLCSIMEVALRNGLNHASIRGTVVFVVKEVVPVMLLWRCPDISSRIGLIEGTFSLLHHVLEEGCVDKELQELVVNELSSVKGGAGATLRSVLESSANLQATLDQPAEWPHSSHARKLTKMAKLALSLAHRLVGQYLTSGDRLSRFFLEGSSNSSSTGGSMSHGVWVTPRTPHLALTIAHFVYHRLNPRLPYLALRTLTRLAKEMGVPLVACLGVEAEGLRDCLLTRLDSHTEDLWVKVALLRLLTLSTFHQPGLIRLFLTPPPPLLDSLVSLLQQQKESKNEAGMELLVAVVELVASLWGNNLTTATSYLRGKKEFWECLAFCLCHKAPGEVNDDVIGGIFKVFSLEYYGSNSQKNICEHFQKNLQVFLEPKSEKFSSWIRYIFLTYIDGKLNPMDDTEGTLCGPKKEKSNNELLENCCQFFIIVLTRSSSLLTDEQKSLLGVSIIKTLLNLFESESEFCDSLQIMLAEVHLSLLNHCGKVMAENSVYTDYLGRLLGALRSSVMQTRAKCQVMIMAGTLKALSGCATRAKAQELSSNLVCASMLLVEQHCSLASSSSENKKGSSLFSCSSSACLALACTLLHQCLDVLSDAKIKTLLEPSHLVYSLIQASVKQTEVGNSSVVKEIHRLMSLIARRTTHVNDLNTNNLAVSVSLVLASQSKLDLSILRDLLWCTIFCLKKEGASGLEGAISLAAVHLSALTSALATPDLQADLALATASLAASLAPYHQLWRVIHQDCFEQLVMATASCIHRTTKMLHLRETLEREVAGDRKGDLKSSLGIAQSGGNLSDGTIALIDQLLRILGTCLETVRYLSPDINDLLCCPDTDLTSCTFDLIQPSIRRQSGNQITLPNLATLADILDLYHTLAPKDGRYNSPLRNAQPAPRIDLSLLTQCAENALFLFMSYSTLIIVSPNVQAREARDVRTFLADETSSFFSHWIGRRAVATASPLPPLSPKLPISNLPYLMLCRQVVTSLCNSKKN